MKKSRIQQTASELTVGFFVFAILGALILFTIVLSYDNIFTRSYRMEVVFDNVTGLIRGDKVYLQGVDVGRVNSLEITPDGVKVELTLKYNVQLREDYNIAVKSSSVLGGKYISIYEGTKEARLLDENFTPAGKAPVDFMVEASEALSSLRNSLENGGILGNLESTMGSLKVITERLEKGEGSIGKLLTEEEVYNDLRQVVADLKDVSGRLSRGEGTIGKLLSSDESIYNDLKETLANINASVGKISAGDGTLGKLINDDSLYNELMKALAELRAMFDDIRETSPVTSLTSIFFGAF
ncbi:MAG TPA: MlaD family protein [Kiritimatiellia bacterium]|nr:MlaD family protein [Kiritimatiellia bacterium]